MKRLLLSSLMGCMLMSQVNASDFRNQIVTGVTNVLSEVSTKAGALDFAKGAGMASLALLVPRTIVMFDSGSREYACILQKCSKSIDWLKYDLSYLRPSKNLLAQRYYLNNESRSLISDLKAADNRSINLNRIAAIFSTLMLGGSLAKLFGYLPLYYNEKEAVTGIAIGSAFSLLLLARNLTKPTYKSSR